MAAGTKGHQLFNDNPRGKPRLKTLGYGTRRKAANSVKKLKTMPTAYQRQAATTMYYRAKHHAKQTKGMRNAMRVYGRFLKTLKRGRPQKGGSASAAAPAATRKYTAVIVEPRKIKSLSLVLKNFAENLSDDWGFQIFHGASNKAWVEGILDREFPTSKDRFLLTQLENEKLTYVDYNSMMKTVKFYEQIPTETFLIFQTDSWLCGPHKDLLAKFMDYDYVGAPWTINVGNGVGNGGLSLRKKSKMIEYIKACPDNTNIFEDQYFANNQCHAVPLKIPSKDEAKEFSIDGVYHPRSFGLHKPWVFLPHKFVDLEKQCPGMITMFKSHREEEA